MASCPRTVILDCDTGADDAIAILMAVGLSPLVRLVGVTTVHGNAAPCITCDNTRRVLAAAGAPDVPVIAGAPCNLRRLSHKKRIKMDEVDGQDQVFDFLPAVAKDIGSTKNDHAAAEWLIETSRVHPDIALVLTGPLTNIALALRQDPTFASRIGSVSIMGGCFDVDWAYSEFNFECDALAAKEVLSADWAVPPVVVGLNVTCQAWLPAWFAKRISTADNLVAKAAAAVLRSNDPSGQGGEMFDPCAFAAWIEPALVQCDDVDVWIDESTGFTALSEEGAKETHKSAVRHVGRLRVAKTIIPAALFDLMSRALHIRDHHTSTNNRNDLADLESK